MLEQTEALIFDLDGTLLDSMWVWIAIDKDYIKKYDLNPPEDFHLQMEGMSFTETAEYFLKTFPDLPYTVEGIKEEWYEMSREKYTREVQLKSGAREFITEARRRGMKTGISTSNDRKLVEETLEALGISELFDVISTSCEVKKGKPAPDVYLKTAGELGVSPSACLVFEDVPMGILAGKNAGMRVCAVDDWFSRPQDEKKRSLADFYIKDYHDIMNDTFEVLS